MKNKKTVDLDNVFGGDVDVALADYAGKLFNGQILDIISCTNCLKKQALVTLHNTGGISLCGPCIRTSFLFYIGIK